MSSLSSVLSALGGAGGSNGVTVATAAVPVGQVQLMPGAQGVSLTLDDGTQWLRSGVIARASDFPTVPAQFQADLNPLVKVADVGSGGMWCAVVADPALGLPLALSKGVGGYLALVPVVSPTNDADKVVFSGTSASLTGSSYTGVIPTKMLVHKGRVAVAHDGTKSGYNGSIPVWSYDQSGSTYSAFTAAGANLPSGGTIGAMASNPAGNMVVIRANSTQTWYAADVNTTVTQGAITASANWTAAAFGGSIFVALAAGGTVAASSPDGVTWTARTLPASLSWSACAYGGNKFVAVASGTNQGAYSTNGTSWTAMTLPASRAWAAVAYSAALGQWVATASDSAFCATSADGITWTERALPAQADWKSVAYSSTLGCWMAVAECGRAGAAYSTDGITWTLKLMPFVLTVDQVVSGGGTTLYALVGFSLNYSGGSPIVGKSTDSGATWRYYIPNISLAYSTNIPTITKFVNSLLVSIGEIGSGQVVVSTSSDGITWTQVGQPVISNVPSGLKDLVWTGTNYVLFAASFNSGADNYQYCWTSTDLLNWTTRTCNAGSSGGGVTWRAVALPSGVVIAVFSMAFPLSRILRSSDNGVTWTIVGLTGQSGFGASEPYYDAARDIVFVSSTANAQQFMSFDRGLTWANISNLQPTNPQDFQFARQGSNGTYVMYGASSAQILRGRLGGGVTLTYSHGFSLKTNRAPNVGQGLGYAPVIVGTDALFLTSANSLVKLDAVKYVDNIRVAGEFNSNYYPGVAVPTLNYYMRVK